jgi:hypothetical protein
MLLLELTEWNLQMGKQLRMMCLGRFEIRRGHGRLSIKQMKIQLIDKWNVWFDRLDIVLPLLAAFDLQSNLIEGCFLYPSTQLVLPLSRLPISISFNLFQQSRIWTWWVDGLVHENQVLRGTPRMHINLTVLVQFSQGSRACQILREIADRSHQSAQNEKCQRAPIWPCSASQTTFPLKPPIVNSMTKALLQGETDLWPTDQGSPFQSQRGHFKNLLRNQSILIGWPQTRGVSDSTKRDLSNDTVRFSIGRLSRESESSEVQWFIFIFQFFTSVAPHNSWICALPKFHLMQCPFHC